MTPVRTIFTVLIAIALAVWPARIGAIGLSSDIAVSSMPDCVSMNDGSCEAELAPVLQASAGDHTPMSVGCDNPGADHGTALPGACSTYCHSLPALPTVHVTTVEIVLIAAIAPAIAATLDGIGISPEPHPPKRVLI